MRVRWQDNGRFAYEDGRTFVPFGGIYANFIQTRQAGIAVPQRDNADGPWYRQSGIIDFTSATPAQLRKWIKWLRKEGMTFTRMFCRGDMGPPQDPLDIGGAVNRPLWEKIRAYLDLLHEGGVYCHFVACVEPRQSIYMNQRVLEQRALPLYAATDIGRLPPHRRRFLDPAVPRLNYSNYFTDTDALQCHLDYLAELATLLRDHPALMSLEIYNEQQWGDHFFWSAHDAEMAWSQRIIEAMHEHFPGKPASCSFAGFGIAAQDPLLWIERVPMDFVSPHAYQLLSGMPRRADFGAMTDAILKYSQSRLPTMMGEWSPNMHVDQPDRLLTRDAAWFALLNGCPGFGMWMARGYGEFEMPRQIAEQIDFACFTPAPEPLVVDISRHVRFFQSLESEPRAACGLPEDIWCPHRPQQPNVNDADRPESGWREVHEPHRYCAKLTSPELEEIYHFARFALIRGVRYRFTADPAEANWDVRHVGSHHVPELHLPFTPVERCAQVKYTAAADESLYLVYVRNFAALSIDDNRGRRLPHPRPLALDVTLPGDCDAQIWDLETRKMRAERVPARSRLALGTTAHDLTIVLRRV